jgi:hypothetical protein
MAPVTRPKPTPSEGASKDAASPWDHSVSQDAVSEGALPSPRSTPPAAAPAASAAAERPARWALLLAAFLLGGAVGTFGSFGHRASATVLGVAWPTGLAICLGGLVGLLLGVGELLEPGRPGSWRPSRLAALSWASVGWLLALLWLTYVGPPPSLARKGDVVLANDWKSVCYLFGGMAAVVVFTYRAWAASLTARLAQHGAAAKGVHPKG